MTTGSKKSFLLAGITEYKTYDIREHERFIAEVQEDEYFAGLIWLLKDLPNNISLLIRVRSRV